MDELLILKPHAVGVDWIIDLMQRHLFLDLTKRFGWRAYKSYPRAYRNEKNGDKLPEVYFEGEYKEVLFDDAYAVSSFFLTDEKRTFDNPSGLWTHGVSIIFQADLDKLYKDCKTCKGRQDEKLIQEVREVIKTRGRDNRLEAIITGVENVYQSLKVSYNKKNFDDMNNFTMARFDFKMVYTNAEKPSLQ